MTTRKNNKHIANHVLGRFAVEAIDVVERHSSIPAVGAHAHRLTPLTERFTSASRDIRQLKLDQGARLAERDARVKALQQTVSAWTGHVNHDVPGFDASAILVSDEAVLDLVANGRAIAETLTERGAELPYAATAASALGSACDAVEEAYQQAKEARVAVQSKQREMREVGDQLYDELVRLRRTLRATLGASHLDYLRLRVVRPRAELEPPGESSNAVAATGVQAVTEPSAGSSTPANDTSRSVA
jgi:hypothetical protein